MSLDLRSLIVLGILIALPACGGGGGAAPTPSPPQATPTPTAIPAGGVIALTGENGTAMLLSLGAVPNGEYASVLPSVPRNFTLPRPSPDPSAPLGVSYPTFYDAVTLWIGPSAVTATDAVLFVLPPIQPVPNLFGANVYDASKSGGSSAADGFLPTVFGSPESVLTNAGTTITLVPGHAYVIEVLHL